MYLVSMPGRPAHKLQSTYCVICLTDDLSPANQHRPLVEGRAREMREEFERACASASCQLVVVAPRVSKVEVGQVTLTLSASRV